MELICGVTNQKHLKNWETMFHSSSLSPMESFTNQWVMFGKGSMTQNYAFSHPNHFKKSQIFLPSPAPESNDCNSFLLCPRIRTFQVSEKANPLLVHVRSSQLAVGQTKAPLAEFKEGLNPPRSLPRRKPICFFLEKIARACFFCEKHRFYLYFVIQVIQFIRGLQCLQTHRILLNSSFC